MMREAFKFLTMEVRGLQRAAYILAICALLSSLLALMRDRLFASQFGASETLDLYYAAFRVPDLLFVCLGALVSVYMLIPEIVRRSEVSRYSYIDTIVVGFCALSALLCAILAIVAPILLSTLYPQYAMSGEFDSLVSLTRVMLLQPIFLGLSNIFAAITQVKNRYALYAISPLLYNLGIIAGIVILYPLIGIQGLGWGVVLGSLLHFGIQVPSVLKDGFFRSVPRLSEPRALLDTIYISLPRALALSMNQITFIGITALAATLTAGSIAVFMFAFNLQAVPLAIIGASYSVAAFPTLASALAAGQREEFIAHVATAARHVLFWSLPATALIIVLRAHVVRVVLGSGAFDWTDTRLTAAAFALLSLSLVAQGLSLLLVRAYYAAGRTFMPFFVSVGVAGTVVALGSIFVSVHNDYLTYAVQDLLRVEDVPGGSVLALAFVYAAVTILGTIFLTLHFEWRFGNFLRQISSAWWQSFVAASVAGFAAYGVLVFLGPLTFVSTTLSVFTKGFVAGVLGIIVAGLTYHFLGNREYAETFGHLRERLSRKKVPESVVPIAASAEDSPAAPQ